MLLSNEFLSTLQQRLTLESRRGVHLNALPGRSRVKFDVQRLALIHPDLPSQFVEQLHQQATFQFPISINSNDLSKVNNPAVIEVARKLNLLQYEVEDILSEKGIATFGFGYPLVIRRDAKDKLVVAPLLIWSLQISRLNKQGSWLVTRTEDDTVVVNHLLIRHLRDDAKVELEELQNRLPEEDVISTTQLKALANYLLDKVNGRSTTAKKEKLPLSKKESLLGEAIQSIPERKALNKEKLHKTRIHWGGLFAVFETQYQSILQDYDQLLLENNVELLLEDLSNESSTALTCMKTDASQQEILDVLSQKRNMVIHGPPGTGKSQTLTAIIINALTKGQKVLVVCGKQTALQVIADHLKTKELHNLAALVKEVKKDRREVVNKARQAIDDRQFYAGEGGLFVNNDFENQVAHCQSLIKEIHSCHDFMRDQIWGEYTWSDVVGLLLNTGIEKEISHNNVPVFTEGEVDVSEWIRVKALLRKGEKYYNAAKPFLDKGILNVERIKAGEEVGLRTELVKMLEQSQERCVQLEELQLQFEESAQQYLSNKYERVFEQVKQQISLVKNHLGKDAGKVSGTPDVLTEAQEYGLGYYRQLCDFMLEEEGPAYEPRHIERPSEVTKELRAIESEMTNWKHSWRNHIQLIVNNIDETTAHSELEELPIYEKLQDKVRALYASLNKDKWLQEKAVLQNKVTDSIKGIEAKIYALKGLLEENGGFHELYNWSQFFYQQNKNDQKLLRRIPAIKNWPESYSYHTLNNILTKNTKAASSVGESTYKVLQSCLDSLEKHQVPFIQSLWRERQRRAVIRFHQRNRLRIDQLYNKRSTASFKKFSLRRIVEKDLVMFQSFFPVVLTTPEVASTLFGNFNGNEVFDLVLFDEASQLKIEETIPALLKGKQKIIVGDEHQMPPSFYFSKKEHKGLIDMEESDDIDLDYSSTDESVATFRSDDYDLNVVSLLNFAASLPFDHRYLDFHYRSRHPALIDFSNAAFYGDQLCPLPPRMWDSPIDFIEVNGSYADGLNEEEVRTVITLLKEQTRKPNGFYPSIGIATFNVKQRNLILENIRAEEMAKPAFAAKMMELRNCGLFVKNLENIQGDEREIMIISTVYGKGPEGKFSSRFGPINQQNGYKLLNVLITRAQCKVVLCTSVPPKVYQSYGKHLKADGNTRKGIFYAWLAYAKVVNEGDENKRQNILSNLRKQGKPVRFRESNFTVTKNIFAASVCEKLKGEITEGTLLLNAEVAGFKVDLLYRPADGKKPMVMIECDGSKRDYCYDLQQAEIFSTEPGSIPQIPGGKTFIRIWSVDWWRDEEGSFKKLLDVLGQWS